MNTSQKRTQLIGIIVLQVISLLIFAFVVLLLVMRQFGGGEQGETTPAAAPAETTATATQPLPDVMTTPTSTLALNPPVETPTSTAQPPASSGSSKYVVKPGDTLSEIALRLGVPLQRLKELNPFINFDILLPGQELIIPGQ